MYNDHLGSATPLDISNSPCVVWSHPREAKCAKHTNARTFKHKLHRREPLNKSARSKKRKQCIRCDATGHLTTDTLISLCEICACAQVPMAQCAAHKFLHRLLHEHHHHRDTLATCSGSRAMLGRLKHKPCTKLPRNPTPSWQQVAQRQTHAQNQISNMQHKSTDGTGHLDARRDHLRTLLIA